MAQRMGRGIALLFHDRGTRRGCVVTSTPRPHFTPGKDTVPTLQEAGWAPGPVWTGGKSRLQRDSIPDRPARSQSLYRLSYPAHEKVLYLKGIEPKFLVRPTFTLIPVLTVLSWHCYKTFYCQKTNSTGQEQCHWCIVTSLIPLRQ